jgi:hypothetical protein
MGCHDVQATDEVRATLQTAAEFGLDEREVQDAMVETWQRVCGGHVEDPLDELAAALAARILEHERRR